MKANNFRLLIWGMVFLFLDIVILIIYTEVLKAQTTVEVQNVDIIYVVKGRNRIALQHALWRKNWQSLHQTKFFALHLNNIDPNHEDTGEGIIHISTPYENEKDLFINIASVMPLERRSPRFLWVSDQIIPLQKISLTIFERNQSSDRFFSGFFPDYQLMKVDFLLESSIPCGLIRYNKMRFSTYEHFMIDFVSGKHRTFAFIAMLFLLPNRDIKPKKPLSSDLFQIAMITPSEMNQSFYNDKIKELWKSYLLH